MGTDAEHVGAAWPTLRGLLERSLEPPPGTEIGRSREGRPLFGHVMGRGPCRVSVIAGCHADEPVGPRLLHVLVGALAATDRDHPLLAALTWYVVPDANPDGAERNRSWPPHAAEEGADLAAYLTGAVREAPGDDVEFGFPRGSGDQEARTENQAIARFLRPGAPFHVHLSLHGMAVASGAWFLVEPAWTDRMEPLARDLIATASALGLGLHDVDRLGDKGFVRLRPGFCTRPSSRAMSRHFEARGDLDTAGRFRPSSMEMVRGWGGDPLTLVSEIPLFVVPRDPKGPLDLDRDPWRGRLQDWRGRLVGGEEASTIREEASQLGLRSVPVVDQMALQWRLIRDGVVEAMGHPRRG